ncbi:hypothetical protein UFOVP1077_8 [uncultured Caudovirales phage]|uniref:Uncharacterized protein n=1 Tax=uncultured Caudovirales phage TaxID=2100421 RepID=A0A6J5SCI2_9CAUD|nr:hypothetical protein UFOVP1077_8 [uncultured Caudovirales phage]CAB4198127.1 hypothetical protein UFOVP1316_51 [uncultured Caudovirales phage]CAB4211327.1 hypothetical protein UFOVP1428_5 [uncultured Caudovirales phage]CAB5227406.1 hypothetical protein UFOVP1526_39 [uncultured Caudovirales phage]
MARNSTNHAVTAFPNNAEVAATDVDYTTESTIYVGGAGNVTVTPLGNEVDVTFIMPAGSVIPVRVKRVLSSGLTATGLVRIW